MPKSVIAAAVAAGALFAPLAPAAAHAAPIDRAPAQARTVWCPPWCKQMPYLSYLCPQPRVCG